MLAPRSNTITKCILYFLRVTFFVLIMNKIRNYIYIWRLRRLNDSIRRLKKYHNWRLQVLIRDKFTCQRCKSIHNLEVHHIQSFINILKEHKIKTRREALKCKPLWSIKNGLTLCHKCHKKTY